MELVGDHCREELAGLIGGERDLVLDAVGFDHEPQAVLLGDPTDVTVALGETERPDRLGDRLTQIHDDGQILDLAEGAPGEAGDELLACLHGRVDAVDGRGDLPGENLLQVHRMQGPGRQLFADDGQFGVAPLAQCLEVRLHQPVGHRHDLTEDLTGGSGQGHVVAL